MRFRKPKTRKICPRCGNKCLIGQERCEECDLVFSRMQYASNKEAKKKIRHFDTDFVIYTNQYPSDVQWWKILLLSIFTGLVGGHYYYVGKYWKGGLMSAGFIYLVFCTIFNAQMVQALTQYAAYLPISFLGIAWMVSLVFVITRKFRVPVIVKLPEDGEVVSDKDKGTEKKEEKEVVVINGVKK